MALRRFVLKLINI